MPFLRLTRDRRGTENTFLLHADRPGDRPRLLYWYRTAPGIVLGRAALDEDAIRTIEEQHPEIDFDWPAILALNEAMMPEDEAAARPSPGGRRPQRRDQPREAQPRRRQDAPPESSAPDTADHAPDDAAIEPALEAQAEQVIEEMAAEAGAQDEAPPAPRHTYGLLEELVGREIATRLRARHSEIAARIHERHVEPLERERWMARAAALDPDTWLTPEAILDGVRQTDAHFEKLRQELLA